ncbi:hypothetical protein HZC09_00590 [Candidatus Micrarchaeota archaeon]|nr:hypothetical protein [Candidatus Micrarchaeota archaeon]
MDKFLVLSILAGLLLVTSIVQAVELGGIKQSLSKTGLVTATAASGGVAAAPAAQSGGETYEQMMQRMHPEQFAQQQTQQASAPAAVANLPNMVGGC